MSVALLWPPSEVIMMAGGSFNLSAFGIYELGVHVQAVYWALASSSETKAITPWLENLRGYTNVQSFEDIGLEATQWSDALLNRPNDILATDERDALRATITKWHALIGERLATRYVIHPTTVIDPKILLSGVNGLLTQPAIDMLTATELNDLDEAIRSLMIESPTASEHMAMRATESLMRRWYEALKGPKLKKWIGWDAPLKWLEENHGAGYPRVIARLKFLKLQRDAIAHPDYISNTTSAQITLLDVCGVGFDIGLASQSESDNN